MSISMDRHYFHSGTPSIVLYVHPVLCHKIQEESTHFDDLICHFVCMPPNRTSDKPRPRGEIWLSGDSLAVGYYNKPELTRDSFVVEGPFNKRWFKTGDIGEFDGEGQLTIVDRKKDIVKMQGRYSTLFQYSSI